MEGVLYRRVFEPRTLWKAWQKVKARGSSGGIDRVTLEDFDRSVESNLKALSRELRDCTYVPEPGEAYFMEKLGSRERWKITRSTVRDKVVQEAVRGVIEPFFESGFRPASFAYRPGKGPKQALAALDGYLREGTVWAASADIDDFFDSIDHNLLLDLVSRRIWEKEILRLIELWLKMGIMSGLNWSEPERGVPQGGVISPLLSHIYLHPFDCSMEESGHALIRYADDFLILKEGPREAENALREAEEILNKELFLRLNAGSKVVRNSHQGFIFLGFLHKKRRRVICEPKLQRIREKIKVIARTSRDLDELRRRMNEAVVGWRSYYDFGNTAEQFEFLDKLIFDEIKIFLGRHGCKPREAREKLAGLELFQVAGERETANFINLALAAFSLSGCTAGSQKGEKGGKAGEGEKADKGRPVEAEIARKRRQYQNRSLEASMLVASAPGSFLGKTSKRAVLKEAGKRIRETPFFALRHVIVASLGVSLSSDLVMQCVEQGVPVSFLDDLGKPYAHIFSPSYPLYRYTSAQAKALEGASGLYLARSFAEGKIRNQINLLKYYRKYRGRRDSLFSEGCDAALEELRRLLARLVEVAVPEEGDYEKGRAKIFGIEGLSAACYWSQVKALIGRYAYFEGREKRGATDLVNSLLNYGYGILYSQIFQAVVLAGLNPNIGFLHKEQPGKPVLVFDLIEEFRQPVVDKTVISLVNKKRHLSMDGVFLDRATRELLARQVFMRLESPTTFRGGKKTYRDIIDHQVRALVSHLEGGKKYRPFIDRW